jgi:hypothetical protein
MWYRICIWHWYLNPGLVINELLLGQRIPKNIHLDTDLGPTLNSQQYVPCDHCDHKIFYSKVSKFKAQFGLWFGMNCPKCKSTIPTELNLFSFLILAILSPVWYYPYKLFKSQLSDYSANKLKEIK